MPTALLIDDDPVQLELLRFCAQEAGYARVLVAESGNEGLRHLDQEAGLIDLITCDLQMPDSDGVEFLGAASERGSRSKILIVSGARPSVVGAADALAKAYQLNVIGLLLKPVEPERLIAAFIDCLPVESDLSHSDSGGMPS